MLPSVTKVHYLQLAILIHRLTISNPFETEITSIKTKKKRFYITITADKGHYYENIAYSLVYLVVMATYLRLQNNACNSYPK